MSLSLTAGTRAIGKGLTTYFLGIGGVEPYTYSVLSGTGSIGASTGLFTAPNTTEVDTVQVEDMNGVKATLTILTGNALELFCDIIQTEMQLDPGRVYLWDQKIDQPKDFGLYIAVAVVSAKPFSNVIKLLDDGTSEQNVNMQAMVQVDAISRGTAARDRKEEIIMALNSFYSQSQQETNGFYVGKLSSSFTNLSPIDGAAIPYRFSIRVNMQYVETKVKSANFIDGFTEPVITVQP